jgi:hypothetical protein
VNVQVKQSKLLTIDTVFHREFVHIFMMFL